METQSDYTQVVNFSLYKTTFSKDWRHILYIKLYISYKLKFHWIWNEWKKLKIMFKCSDGNKVVHRYWKAKIKGLPKYYRNFS